MALAAHRRARFGEQRSDRRFGLGVVALARGGVADVSFGVDQIVGGPVLVRVRVPGAHFVVLHHGVAQAKLVDRVLYVRGLLLEGELRRLHADDVEAVFAVGGVPRLQVGKGPDAVDAGVGPEVHEHHMSTQPAQAERVIARRVEPVLGVLEFGRRAEVLQAVSVGEQDGVAGVAGRRRGFARGRELGSVAGQFGQAALDRFRFLEARGEVDVGDVFGYVLIEAHVHSHHDRERGGQHDRAERALKREAAAGGADAVEQLATAQRQREQHGGAAERVGDRHRHGAPAGGAHRDHGGQDRAGAGRVHEAERRADDQARAKAIAPVRSPARAERGDAGQPGLQTVGQARHDQRQARGDQDRTATSRSGSEPKPTPSTTSATPTIVTVKVTVKPITTPSGLRLPPTPPEASRAGSTGSTQGDSAVPAPARTANPIKTIIAS